MPMTKPFPRIVGNKCDRSPYGCTNEATLALGGGRFRICDACSVRVEFEHFSKRVPLKVVA